MTKQDDRDQAFLAAAKKKHKEFFNCKLGFKRCTKCDVVAHKDLFVTRSNWCKACMAILQAKYRAAQIKKRVEETGEPHRVKRGRPAGAKNKPKD